MRLAQAAAVLVALATIVACSGAPAGGSCSHPSDCASGETCVEWANQPSRCATKCSSASDCSGPTSACKSVPTVGCCSTCFCDAELVCVAP